MADPSRLARSRSAHGISVTVSWRGALPLMLLQSVACASDQSSTGEHPNSTWTTESEHQFADAPERNVFFSRPYARIDPARNRVFVLDAANSQVSVWTDRGSFLFVVGRSGEGPGEFGFPQDMFIDADGSLLVLDNSGVRFTYFRADGQLIGTELGQDNSVSYQGFNLAVTFPRDGIYLGVVRASADIDAGIGGVSPFVHQPLLSVRRSRTGQWEAPRPLLWLDVSNRIRVLKHPDGHSSYGNQPFGDGDQFRLERGAAVVMRLKEAPGAVELIEVSGEGDTVWHRRLSFEPRRLTSGMRSWTPSEYTMWSAGASRTRHPAAYSCPHGSGSATRPRPMSGASGGIQWTGLTSSAGGSSRLLREMGAIGDEQPVSCHDCPSATRLDEALGDAVCTPARSPRTTAERRSLGEVGPSIGFHSRSPRAENRPNVGINPISLPVGVLKGSRASSARMCGADRL